MILRQVQGKRSLILLMLLALAVYPEATRGAGFAKDPIFLSRSPVTEGQSVRVYAVVSNTDTAAFVGSLVFYDGDSKIGSSDINLAAGATQTASVSWIPNAGAHQLNAKLIAKNGTVSEQVNGTFTIQSKPKPISATPSGNTQSATTISSSAEHCRCIAASCRSH
jgi:hypothetical protein